MESNSSNRSNSKKSARTLEWMRALTLKQWRYGDPVKDPTRNIHSADEHLDKLLKEVGVTGGMEQERLLAAWQSVAGDFISKNATPESLKRGILVLRVLQPSMRFHLEQMKGKLMQNLKRELGVGVVKQIRFKIG